MKKCLFSYFLWFSTVILFYKLVYCKLYSQAKLFSFFWGWMLEPIKWTDQLTDPYPSKCLKRPSSIVHFDTIVHSHPFGPSTSNLTQNFFLLIYFRMNWNELTCNEMKDHNDFSIDVWVASERENDLISESKPGHNQPEHHHGPTLKIIIWKNTRTNRKSPF